MDVFFPICRRERPALQTKYFANRLTENSGAAARRYNKRRDEKRLP
jgi:hypothetical protein